MGVLAPLLLAATVLAAWRLLSRPCGPGSDYVAPATLERVLAEAAREELQFTMAQAPGRRPKPAPSPARTYITAWPAR